MHTMKAGMVFIQETHLHSNANPKLENVFFLHVYHATSAVSKTKGASVLISKDAPLQISETMLDIQEQYVFIKRYSQGHSHHVDKHL